MGETVECPYCEFENDMSDGHIDLPSDNTFDSECENCEREFEVTVEFEPTYNANEIVYMACERCGDVNRDSMKKGRVFPYPEAFSENVVCTPCYLKGMGEQYEKESWVGWKEVGRQVYDNEKLQSDVNDYLSMRRWDLDTLTNIYKEEFQENAVDGKWKTLNGWFYGFYGEGAVR